MTATVTNYSVTDISAENGSVAALSDSNTTAAVKIDQDTKTAITRNNNLTEISPTGYVTRFVPYAMILIAGMALMIVAMKKRKTTDEE